MPIITPCPSCHAKVRLEDRLAGRKVRCPKCKHTFMAPPEEAAVVLGPGIDRDQAVARVQRNHGRRSGIAGGGQARQIPAAYRGRRDSIFERQDRQRRAPRP
jgi:predicted Zn finger-like uncharacterized protein